MGLPMPMVAVVVWRSIPMDVDGVLDRRPRRIIDEVIVKLKE